jgi:cation/acetate symporter
VALLLSIDASTAIMTIGALMICYLLFGGMVATSYVQIVKAILVFCATCFLTFLLLSRFDFSVSSLMSAAATSSGKGEAFPRRLFCSPTSSISFRSVLVSSWVPRGYRTS